MVIVDRVAKHPVTWRPTTMAAALALAVLTASLTAAKPAPVPHTGTGLAASSGGTWGKAQQVPGMARLNRGPLASVASVSCTGPGDCAAGGNYGNRVGTQAFVAAESNGRWRVAEEVPGTAALNKGNDASVWVSCATPGNCGGGGSYASSRGHQQAFVVSESHGRWGAAEEAPGTGAMNVGGNSAVTSLSCRSPGNCSAGGFYASKRFHTQAFVIDETHGMWGSAEEVPGTAALNKANAQVDQVSCASPGNCGAAGSYTDASDSQQVFVVNETGGTWGTAHQLRGTAASSVGPDPVTTVSVSCPTAGACEAGGSFSNASGHQEAFVATEVNGVWKAAAEVRGTTPTTNAGVESVSCASAGNCGAGGYYTGTSGNQQAFVMAQTADRWGRAKEVPGTPVLNKGGGAEIASLSCASAGNCSAVGTYADGIHEPQAFVVSEVNGTWHNAENVPGLASLNRPPGDQDAAQSVSCSSSGHCSAGGYYSDVPVIYNKPFVVSES
jgi:hypothetical protein